MCMIVVQFLDSVEVCIFVFLLFVYVNRLHFPNL